MLHERVSLHLLHLLCDLKNAEAIYVSDGDRYGGKNQNRGKGAIVRSQRSLWVPYAGLV